MSITNNRSVKKTLTCFSQSELADMAEQIGFTIRLRNSCLEGEIGINT